MSLQLQNIGAHVKLLVPLKPQNSTGGTLNGDAIDRDDYEWPLSLVIAPRVGAVTGTPTSFTFIGKVQDDADNGSGAAAGTWADYKPDGVTVATASTITAANGTAELDVDLTGARRHVRVVGTLAFVGGTTPATDVAIAVALGGAGVEVV